MRALSLVALQFLFFTSLCQEVTKDQVIESLEALRKDIRTYNPGLDIYNPNFDARYDEILAGLDKDSFSPIEHFRLVSELCTASNEGHFAMGNWKDTPHKGFVGETYNYLPLTVEVLNNSIYIWNDYSNENLLSKGDKIIAINGQSSQEILDQLMRYIHSDGNIVGYVHRSISAGLNWMYYLYIDTPSSFEITYQSIDSGENKKVTIGALKRSEILSNYEKRASKQSTDQSKESISDVYEFEVTDNYALLKLKTFNRQKLEKYEIKSTKFYQEIFEKIQSSDVSTLIIDLRNNNGGKKEFSNDIVPYILKTDNGHPYLRKSLSWHGKEKTFKFPKKNKISFQGQVIGIVNAGTYSSAGSLARFLKEYANAIFVGQETATRYEGFSAGSKQYVDVLHSDVSIGIPRYLSIFPKSEKQTTNDRGLIPDHVIEYQFNDLVDEQDLEMEFVLSELIK
ncbi:S41 family peptidase [Ekhidna sp.]